MSPSVAHDCSLFLSLFFFLFRSPVRYRFSESRVTRLRLPFAAGLLSRFRLVASPIIIIRADRAFACTDVKSSDDGRSIQKEYIVVVRQSTACYATSVEHVVAFDVNTDTLTAVERRDRDSGVRAFFLAYDDRQM